MQGIRITGPQPISQPNIYMAREFFASSVQASQVVGPPPLLKRSQPGPKRQRRLPPFYVILSSFSQGLFSTTLNSEVVLFSLWFHTIYLEKK
jgi:hypothetical protein